MSRDYRWDWDNLSDKDKSSLQELYQLKYNLVLDIYRRRARRIEAVHVREHSLSNLDDWEYYLYKIFGARTMGSIAFSFDPYWQLIDISKKEFGVPKKFIDALSPTIVTPVNRHTKFLSILPSQTLFKELKSNHSSSDHLVFSGGVFSASGMSDSVTNTPFTVAPLPFQEPCYGWRHDTTWKTRNPGAKVTKKTIKKLPNREGEYELFVPTIVAQNAVYGYKHDQTRQAVVQAVGNPHPPTLHAFLDAYWSGYSTGPTCTISDATCQAYYQAEHIYGKSIMVKNLDRMMAQTLPNRRYFNLAYQIGELKDVPQSIKGVLHSWRECQRLMGTDTFLKAFNDRLWWTRRNVVKYTPAFRALPNFDLDKEAAALYLNFKFGWQSLFQAIQKMVTTPEKAANDINEIIRRNGKFTNLSYQIGWSEKIDPPPSLNLPGSTVILTVDPSNPGGVTATRDISLRCVTRNGFNFPTVDEPSFKMKLFLDKMGLSFTPADAYDLIPWTWMTDWFTGATSYIHLMDRINGTKDLIDHSFITYKSLARVKGDRKFTGLSTVGWKNVPPDAGVDPMHTETYTYRYTMSGEVQLKYELRLSVASLINVKTYAGQNLAADQALTIGALFSAYT